eukprot:GHVQ01029379.1.p1 GENE.GHVQ01029379.1~~GHVQ01029379.1.p1  ORF type:complete len:172 (+),score=12.21 GHVQ01029379.1:402-917(+)
MASNTFLLVGRPVRISVAERNIRSFFRQECVHRNWLMKALTGTFLMIILLSGFCLSPFITPMGVHASAVSPDRRDAQHPTDLVRSPVVAQPRSLGTSANTLFYYTGLIGGNMCFLLVVGVACAFAMFMFLPRNRRLIFDQIPRKGKDKGSKHAKEDKRESDQVPLIADSPV